MSIKIISDYGKKILAGIFLAYLVFLLLPQTLTEFEKAKFSRDHQKIAEKFYKNFNFIQAEKEFLLAKNSTSAALINQKILEPSVIKQKIDTIETIVEKYPDYRDAYLLLAKYYYQIYQPEKAQENLNKALELDPTYEVSLQLREEFQK